MATKSNSTTKPRRVALQPNPEKDPMVKAARDYTAAFTTLNTACLIDPEWIDRGDIDDHPAWEKLHAAERKMMRIPVTSLAGALAVLQVVNLDLLRFSNSGTKICRSACRYLRKVKGDTILMTVP